MVRPPVVVDPEAIAAVTEAIAHASQAQRHALTVTRREINARRLTVAAAAQLHGVSERTLARQLASHLAEASTDGRG